MPTALVLLAEGAEEMETVITVDVLRRGDVDVTLASLTGNYPVQCSRKVSIKPDCSLNDALKEGPYDAIVLPGGGKGAENLALSKTVGESLQDHEARGSIIAAICAAPVVLKAHGIAKGKRITSYPSVKNKIEDFYKYVEERVVVDDRLLTSRGPGTAFEFAVKLVEMLNGKGKSDPLPAQMLLKD